MNRFIALAEDLSNRLAAESGLEARCRIIAASSLSPAVFTTSFGLEDQALTHALAEAKAPIVFATLDTGRLFTQTLDVWAETQARYGIRIRAFSPSGEDVEALLADQGPEGFRYLVDNRKACCHVRKVVPLARALKGAELWITGLRGSQSDARAASPFAVFDETYRLIKANPLADWSREDVVAFTQSRRVPVNALHKDGFLSIGCAPCTRAVAPGEPERAGRWWWESEDKKECGLHVAG